MKFKSIALETIQTRTYVDNDGYTMTSHDVRLIGLDVKGGLWYTEDDGANWYQYLIGTLHPNKLKVKERV
jgi:hypothetical protein